MTEQKVVTKRTPLRATVSGRVPDYFEFGGSIYGGEEFIDP
jgi:hypothetical protein